MQVSSKNNPIVDELYKIVINIDMQIFTINKQLKLLSQQRKVAYKKMIAAKLII